MTATGGVNPAGTTFNIHDTFGTQNLFNGGNIGLRTEWYMSPRWSFDVLTKVAIGVVDEKVSIAGNTVTTVPGSPATTANGGILALPQTVTGVGPGGNIGDYNRTRFTVLPEIDANFHFQLTPLWRVNFGYSFMYIANVVRPGAQIDPVVDPNRFPPPLTPANPHPTFTWNESSLWLQGVNLGMEARF